MTAQDSSLEQIVFSSFALFLAEVILTGRPLPFFSQQPSSCIRHSSFVAITGNSICTFQPENLPKETTSVLKVS
jgi:hypothetical protein